jgi:hypothetical protein
VGETGGREGGVPRRGRARARPRRPRTRARDRQGPRGPLRRRREGPGARARGVPLRPAAAARPVHGRQVPCCFPAFYSVVLVVHTLVKIVGNLALLVKFFSYCNFGFVNTCNSSPQKYFGRPVHWCFEEEF